MGIANVLLRGAARRGQRPPSGHRAAGLGSRSFGKMRLLIALGIAAFAFISFLSSRETNEITGETQYIGMSEEQEVAMGLHAAPEMAAQHGGLSRSARDREFVSAVGQKLVRANQLDTRTKWQFDFHLLADPNTINAFALPGGQCFITEALYAQLKTEGQLAGVLGHEIGHVIARHSAQRMAKQQLTQGLVGAAGAATDDGSGAQMAAMIGQMVNMKYGREDELESDRLGLKFMYEAGYNPYAMVGVMEILRDSRGGSAQPEFFSTHPNPENRIEKIEATIRDMFGAEMPGDLKP